MILQIDERAKRRDGVGVGGEEGLFVLSTFFLG
jgi:hypothetical protein